MLLHIFHHPNGLLHDMGPDHLEAPIRLKLIKQALDESNLSLEYFKAEAATPKEIRRVHHESLIESLQQTQTIGKRIFTEDTIANKYTFQAALTAAGGSIQTAINTYRNHSFAMLRPPGHHATYDQAMGFCFLNNISIAAKHLQNMRTRRIAILDIDNHHGNGTQSIFYEDPSVLYISLHAHPSITFPGTGYIAETGKGDGGGFNVNIPLPFKTGDDDYLYIFDSIVEPILRQYKPDTLLVSLGVDSLDQDPYGALGLSTEVFELLGARIQTINAAVAKNNLGVFLEGGYKYEDIGQATVNFFTGIFDFKNYEKDLLDPTRKAQRIVYDVRNAHRNFWYAI